MSAVLVPRVILEPVLIRQEPLLVIALVPGLREIPAKMVRFNGVLRKPVFGVSDQVTTQLICAFVFTQAKSKFSRDAAQSSFVYILLFMLILYNFLSIYFAFQVEIVNILATYFAFRDEMIYFLLGHVSTLFCF